MFESDNVLLVHDLLCVGCLKFMGYSGKKTEAVCRSCYDKQAIKDKENAKRRLGQG